MFVRQESLRKSDIHAAARAADGIAIDSLAEKVADLAMIMLDPRSRAGMTDIALFDTLRDLARGVVPAGTCRAHELAGGIATRAA